MSNHLKDQLSPYLLQHAENPVEWYPWCGQAFERAKAEDKPIFLSIGYSSCHWCHVMARESFEAPEVADILNKYFICVKVDKEERPDIDSVYMTVCQAFTGSGGWPMSIFMTPAQKPFFAGTYFPKTPRYGTMGFIELLTVIHEKWQSDRQTLLESADQIVDYFNRQQHAQSTSEIQLIDSAVEMYKRSYDGKYGGFGDAPKFPSPHNLLFLMTHYEKTGDRQALSMAEKSLTQMYRGGLFDHIGYGFSRYSTDRYFLAPHFEKMLYDNALLIMSYCKAFCITQKPLYLDVAEKTAQYILREMTSPDGAFYSAQDADSNGEEGGYYLFKPYEIIDILGLDSGGEFNRYYDITEHGNFNGKSIPNLLKVSEPTNDFEKYLPALYEYRKNRSCLHLDDKILTSWNALMITAMSWLYRASGNAAYLQAAKKAQAFIQNRLCDNKSLFVGLRDDKRGNPGFLDDYAFYIFSLIALYEATLDNSYIKMAREFLDVALDYFYDGEQGGFWLYGTANESLIFRPKDTFDGALPCGNSIMAHNLVRLYYITREDTIKHLAKRQLDFISGEAKQYPAGHAMFLTALSDYFDAPEIITVVTKDDALPDDLPLKISLGAIVTVLNSPTEEYRIINDKTTFYICKGHKCMPPSNRLSRDLSRSTV